MSEKREVTPIEKLFEDYDISDYEPIKIDWGEDVGAEKIED